MVNGELLFEWEPGNPIVSDNVSENTSPILDTLREQKNTGHDAVIFDNIEHGETEDNNELDMVLNG